MRYNPRRNYLYPVLRPFADDYPGGNLKTEIQANVVEKSVNVSVIFEVSEPSIQDQVSKGDAVCAAMLYCGSTLHREMIRAGLGSTRAERFNFHRPITRRRGGASVNYRGQGHHTNICYHASRIQFRTRDYRTMEPLSNRQDMASSKSIQRPVPRRVYSTAK